MSSRSLSLLVNLGNAVVAWRTVAMVFAGMALLELGGLLYLSVHQKTTLIPPRLMYAKTKIVLGDTPMEEYAYMADLATSDAEVMLSWYFDNFSVRASRFLSRVHPSKIEAFRRQLEKQKEDVQRLQRAQSFYPKTKKLIRTGLVEIGGLLVVTDSGVEVMRGQVMYRIQYAEGAQGIPEIVGFEPVKAPGTAN